MCYIPSMGLSQWLRVKNSPANARDTDLIPWSGRYPGEGMTNHFSILPGNSKDRGADE